MVQLVQYPRVDQNCIFQRMASIYGIAVDCVLATMEETYPWTQLMINLCPEARRLTLVFIQASVLADAIIIHINS